MRKTDLAYAAGIMDGEGSIGIYCNSSNPKSPSHRMRVRVTNTDRWLVNWLKASFGGTVGINKVRPGHNWKQMWYWTVSCHKAVGVLKDLLPYLHMKRPQAELAIEFQKTRRRGVKPTGANRENADTMAAKMKKLNTRGLT